MLRKAEKSIPRLYRVFYLVRAYISVYGANRKKACSYIAAINAAQIAKYSTTEQKRSLRKIKKYPMLNAWDIYICMGVSCPTHQDRYSGHSLA